MSNRILMWLIAGGVLVAAIGGGFALAYWKRAGSAAQYLPALNATENALGIPHDLLARVAYQESRFRDDIITGAVVSSAGAQGIMQIIPRWHPDVNPLDPQAAIKYAGGYLRSLYRQFGSWKLALAAYNWGEGNLAKYVNQPSQWPTRTLQYIAEITKDVPVT